MIPPCVTLETPEERGQRRALERARRQAIAHSLKQANLQEQVDTLKAELAERDGMLCAVLSCFDEQGRWDLYAEVDWKEAGISANLIESWWAEHKLRDTERRVREAEVRDRRRQELLARLSPEDRELLGIKG